MEYLDQIPQNAAGKCARGNGVARVKVTGQALDLSLVRIATV